MQRLPDSWALQLQNSLHALAKPNHAVLAVAILLGTNNANTASA
jgi:hypothetical protein